MSLIKRPLPVALAFAGLFTASALADGKCELSSWELDLDEAASAFPTATETARWADGQLLGRDEGFAIDIGADGTVDLEAEFASTAHLLLPMANTMGCADYTCTSELGGDFVVSSASRADLLGATLSVNSNRAVLIFVQEGSVVQVVWTLGDWLGELR